MASIHGFGNVGNVGGNNNVGRRNPAQQAEKEVTFNDGFHSTAGISAEPTISRNLNTAPPSEPAALVHPEVADMHAGMLSGHLPVAKSELANFQQGILGLGVIAEINQVGEALGPKGTTLGIELAGPNNLADWAAYCSKHPARQ